MVGRIRVKLENDGEMLNQPKGTLTQPIVYDLSDDD